LSSASTRVVHIHILCLSLMATPVTEVYPLSLHDALPICRRAGPARDTRYAGPPLPRRRPSAPCRSPAASRPGAGPAPRTARRARSEEHTSELQSRSDLVCRLLLEKKKYLDSPH